MLDKKITSIVISLVLIITTFSICSKNLCKVYAATDVSNLNPTSSTCEFITSLEGFSSQCFWDNRQWTIGYGNKCPYTHTSNGKRGQKGGHYISKEDAVSLFQKNLTSYVNTLKSNCSGLSMTQNQFDALLSATYNHGNVKACPLKYFLQGTLSESEAREKYYVWCINAGTADEAGLRNRRKKEAERFFSGLDDSSDIVTPTIATDKSSYIVGDTINISWAASPSNSNISHYWINVIAPDGTWIHEGNMNLSTSYSFSASQEGEYTVRVYATPKGSKDGEGSLSDERKISVASATWYGSLTPVNLGETFDSVLLAKDPWITIRALGAEEDYNVILQSEQGVTSEMWRFTRQDDGSYVITNFATGRVLDAYGLGTTDFTNVFTDVYNGGGNQKWFIYEKNGGYVLRPAYSDMVLDVDHAIFESGTNIEIHTQNDSTAQNFALYYENASYGTPKTGNIIAKADECNVTLNIDKGFYIDQQNIYRSKDGINWSLISTGTNEDNLTVTDDGLNENTTYYYKVIYINRYYNIESGTVSVTTGHKSIIGDCNNDGSFTVADIVMLQKWLLNDRTVLDNWKAADLYGDNVINVFDLALMKQMIANAE